MRFVTSLLFSLTLLVAIISFTQNASTAPAVVPDIRFTLQTQAGLSAYTTLTDTIPMLNASQLFTSIDAIYDDYIIGTYKLAGRNQTVYLAIGTDGWIIAYHSLGVGSQLLMDCTYSFSISEIVGRPERAVNEVANALGFPSPTIGFYDFRHPEANGIILHWLYTPNSSTETSSLTLPLDNFYLERGYAFCTALTYSNFWLNSEIVDSQGHVSSVVYRWGMLDTAQLRAGQTNTLKIQATSFWGHGFFAGVSAVYTGNAEITNSGGYARQFDLAYPVMFGEPLIITRNYLPTIQGKP